MELNDTDDLIKFINKETKKESELDIKTGYKIYCRSLPKIITLLYTKTYHIHLVNFIDILIAGCDIFHNVFWYIIRYTNNNDVALFLSETSIDLFLESIQSSFDGAQEGLFRIIPNVSDSISYSYKKTIGALPASFRSSQKIDTYQTSSLMVKMILVQLFRQVIYAGILPNNCTTKLEEIPSDINLIIDYLQQNNKNLVSEIWLILHTIMTQNSENLTDKLYYQINYFIDNYLTTQHQKYRHNTIQIKKHQIDDVFKYIKSLVTIIKDLEQTK